MASIVSRPQCVNIWGKGFGYRPNKLRLVPYTSVAFKTQVMINPDMNSR